MASWKKSSACGSGLNALAIAKKLPQFGIVTAMLDLIRPLEEIPAAATATAMNPSTLLTVCRKGREQISRPSGRSFHQSGGENATAQT